MGCLVTYQAACNGAIPTEWERTNFCGSQGRGHGGNMQAGVAVLLPALRYLETVKPIALSRQASRYE